MFPPQDNTFALIEGIVNSLAPAAVDIEGVPSIKLPMALEQGHVRVGFLPLGQIPPLFPAGS